MNDESERLESGSAASRVEALIAMGRYEQALPLATQVAAALSQSPGQVAALATQSALHVSRVWSHSMRVAFHVPLAA